MQKKERRLLPTKKIPLSAGRRLQIGSAYQSDLFYRFENRIAPLHASLTVQKDGAELLLYETKEGCVLNRREGEQRALYENKEGTYQALLTYGDEIELYGLWMKYLGSWLLVNVYYGDMRIAVRNGRSADAAYGGN